MKADTLSCQPSDHLHLVEFAVLGTQAFVVCAEEVVNVSELSAGDEIGPHHGLLLGERLAIVTAEQEVNDRKQLCF